MYGSQVAAILVSVLAIVIGAAAQDDGSTIAATDPDQWLTELNDGNWREAAAIAHRWADLPPDQGYDLLAAVVEEVKTRHPIDERYVFALAWSSGGPMVYAASLARDRPITGSLIAMSVFRPEQLPPLSAAKGRCYYLLHSPEDFIAMSHPTAARDQLAANGATVTLVTYEGGHGWHGDVFGNIRAGLVWLEGCRGGNGGTVDSGGEAVRRE